jgi:hypothetical protein
MRRAARPRRRQCQPHEQAAAGDHQRFDADGGSGEANALDNDLLPTTWPQRLPVDAMSQLPEPLPFVAELRLHRAQW